MHLITLTLRFGCSLLLVATVVGASPGAGVVINEILVSNDTTNFDEDASSADWIELYNAAAGPVDLAGFSLSDDIREPRKWIFPSIVLASGERILVWCSGKDRWFRPGEVIESRNPRATFDASLVDSRASWRVRHPLGDAGEPAGWTSVQFEDMAWEETKLPLDLAAPARLKDLTETKGRLYMRHSFDVGAAADLQALMLQVEYTTSFTAYLNGVPIASASHPGDAEPGFEQLATRRLATPRWRRVDMSELDLLEHGRNTLAIELPYTTQHPGDRFIVPELGRLRSVLHSNFRLQPRETLVLTGPDGVVRESIIVPSQTSDRSYGRSPDVTGDFVYHRDPTPLRRNEGPVSRHVISGRPTMEPPGGSYREPLEVAITSTLSSEDGDIRYTRDGSEPTPRSSRYESPIALWPGGDRKGTVIRAAVYSGEERISAIETQSYFTSTYSFELPLLSLSMDDANFQAMHLLASSHGRGSERRAHMELIDTSGRRVAHTGVGIRLHGGEAGRTGNRATKKSYRLYFRDRYGDKRLRHPWIADTDVRDFDKLVLRANFNDSFRTGSGATYIRDSVVRSLHADMGDVAAHGSWVNVFVNMEYRGLFNVVERIDRSFLQSYFPESGGDWDVIREGELIEGERDGWVELLDFLTEHDLADADHYAKLGELVDLSNFTRYVILNLWAQNHDWPQRNYTAARQRPEGKWMFFVWDGEAGLGRNPEGFSVDSLSRLLTYERFPLGKIFCALWQNAEYRAFFLDEIDRQLDSNLAPENVHRHIRRIAALIEPDMHEELERHHPEAALAELWARNIQTLVTFASHRAAVMRAFVGRAEQLKRNAQ